MTVNENYIGLVFSLLRLCIHKYVLRHYAHVFSLSGVSVYHSTNWFATEEQTLMIHSSNFCKTVLSANIQSKNFFSTFEVRKVCVSTLMLSKLLAERKKEEMKDRAKAARKRTVKQTEKPLALVVKAKWLSNVNTTAHDMDID